MFPERSVKIIDGSEKRNRQLVFELQDSHVCEKRSNKDIIIIKPLIIALLLMKIALFLALMPFRNCLKLFGRPGGLHDRFRLPWLQTTITRQLEVLVTTLATKQGSTDNKK